ncbi:MAG: hypothetical protein JSS23_12380 [Proteobacteria bacterium]|nr:hypothetical protein [Pseudomonadota bacterium]
MSISLSQRSVIGAILDTCLMANEPEEGPIFAVEINGFDEILKVSCWLARGELPKEWLIHLCARNAREEAERVKVALSEIVIQHFAERRAKRKELRKRPRQPACAPATPQVELPAEVTP